MYAAPPEVTARVFASLPTALHGKASESGWLQQQHKGRQLPAFFEGPSFDRNGNLYCVDVAYGRIFRIDMQGGFELVAKYDGEPNGLKFHQDGRIFITDYRHGIMVLDPHNGRVEPYFTRPMFERFHGVNDLHFSPNGDLYFTDQGQSGLQRPNGRLFRINTQGKLDCLLDNVPSPNGLTFNAAGTDLLLAVTRANAVWRVRFFPDGNVAKSGIFIQLSGGLAGPDGLAIDQDDNLLICHMGMGTVWKFSRLGEPLLRIRAPEGLLTSNCAFGGPDNKTLFITNSETGQILAADLDVPGVKPFGLS